MEAPSSTVPTIKGSKHRILPNWVKSVFPFTSKLRRLKRSEHVIELEGTAIPLGTGIDKATAIRQHSISRGQFPPWRDFLVARPAPIQTQTGQHQGVVTDGYYGETLQNIAALDDRSKSTQEDDQQSREPFCLNAPDSSNGDVRQNSLWNNDNDGYPLAAQRMLRAAPVHVRKPSSLPLHDPKMAPARYLEARRPPGVPRPPAIWNDLHGKCQQNPQATIMRDVQGSEEGRTAYHPNITAQQSSQSQDLALQVTAHAMSENLYQDRSSELQPRTHIGTRNSTEYERLGEIHRIVDNALGVLHQQCKADTFGEPEKTHSESNQQGNLQHIDEPNEEFGMDFKLHSNYNREMTTGTPAEPLHHDPRFTHNAECGMISEQHPSRFCGNSEPVSQLVQGHVHPQCINFSYPRRTQITRERNVRSADQSGKT